ncbi:g3632 [Coccomyxa viridis]|uniref:G3632 protein n=1 Tax=Coccomyxa viridis TaxID=1274662 RepID=A0ABP1FTE9_9CHLO
MSPFSPSKCPLCRASFGHFPDVCNLLHHFLLKAFPEQSEARAEETDEVEEGEGVTSVEVNMPAVFEENEWAQAVHSRQEPRLSLADFLCATPGCMQLLHDPVVLNCGCCVCSACRPPLGGSCPRCGALSVTAAFGCSKLKELVGQLFPEPEYRGQCRAAKQQSLAASEDPERAKRAKVEEAPRNCAAEKQSQSASPSSIEPVEHDTSHAAIHSRLAAANTHYGIACDYCGQYPIVGKRWQCLECLERVGFDLCAVCYERRADVVGRFNQHHKAEHNMKEVHIAPNFLHVLQAANPELDMPQILGMMQMAFDSEEPPIPYTHRGGPRPSYETHPMAPGNLTAAAMLAQGQLSDEDDMASADMLAQSQGPAFLQPGQLGDQIPMAVSRDRNHGDASSSRQQTGPVQVGIEAAARDERLSDDVSVTISTSAADAQSGEQQHTQRVQGELQGVAIGVTPEGALLTVVIPSLHAAAGSRPAVDPGRPAEEHHDTPDA